MVVAGPLPGRPAPDHQVALAPRVGDGLIRLDEAGVVTFASPNALSAYRRLGLSADLVGAHLGDVTATLARRTGPVDEALSMVVSGWAAREAEVEAAGHDGAAAGHPADRRTACGRRRWCCAATSPRCAAASASWSARTPPSARSTTG